MNLTEKAAYIRGLVEGMKIDTESNEGKIISAIVDMLDDMALSVADLEDTTAELEEYIEEVDEDLGALEEDIYGDDFEECDGNCETCEEDCEGFEDDGYHYQTECPECGELVLLDDEILEDGVFECPHCGKEINFDDDVTVEE